MLSELIASCQESPSAGEFEGSVLELLQREVGFDVAYFSMKGDEANPSVDGVAAPIVERAVQRGPTYLKELFPVKQAALAARGVAVDTQVLGEQRLHATRYYRELVVPAGVAHSLMAYVPWRGSVIGAIMLARATGFSARELQRVERSLAGIGLGRAAFGLPWASAPLPQGRASNWFARLWRDEQHLGEVQTPIGTLLVRDRRGFREMVALDGHSSLVWTRASVTRPSESGWPYVDLFHVAAALAQRRERALFIGCGGGVLPRQFASVYPSMRIDVVEREPAVLELARAWFDLDAIPNLHVHLGDGVDFVRQAPARSWDVLAIDAYDAHELAAGVAHGGFFAELRRVLRPGGALALNVIGCLDGTGALPGLVRAAREAFGDVRIVPVMSSDATYAPDAVRNIVLVAK
jgi:spermidine synthase